MKTTDISTKDSEIEIYYGMINFKDEPREAAYSSVKYLYTDLTDIRKYYIRLGFHLNEFARCEYYKDFGFATLEEFSEKNLGLDKSAVSRCINVYQNFNASWDVTYKNGVTSRGCAMDLGEKWQDFSYTQLCEMLPLSEEQRKDIKPEMSIKQIREYKKSLKNKKSAVDASEDTLNNADNPVASTQQFVYGKFLELHGAAEQSYIKKCDSVSSKFIHIFDSNGKRLISNVWVDILQDKNKICVIRLRSATKADNLLPDTDKED